MPAEAVTIKDFGTENHPSVASTQKPANAYNHLPHRGETGRACGTSERELVGQ